MKTMLPTQPHALTFRGRWLIALMVSVVMCVGQGAIAQTQDYEYEMEYEVMPGSPGSNLHPDLTGLAVQQTSSFIDLVSRRLRTNTTGGVAVYGAAVGPGAPMLLGENSTADPLRRISMTDDGEFVVRAQGPAAPGFGPAYGGPAYGDATYGGSVYGDGTYGGSVYGGSTYGGPAYGAMGPVPPFTPRLGSAWASGFGLNGDVDTDPIARGFEYTMTGTAFGIEQQFTPILVAGLVGGYSNAHVEMDAPHATADIDAYHAGLYGHLAEGIFYVSSVVAYGYQHYDTTRRIPADAETARANYKGNEVAAYVEKGLNLSFAGVRVQPLIGLQYVGMKRDSFRERGAPMNNLTAISDHVDSLRMSVGGRVAPEVPEGFWGSVYPEFRGRWVHEFLDDNQVLGANVAGPPAGNFLVSSPSFGRNFGVFGAGLNAQLSPNVNVYLDYDFQFSSQLTAHSGGGGLELLW